VPISLKKSLLTKYFAYI